jgi:hypothetical protein
MGTGAKVALFGGVAVAVIVLVVVIVVIAAAKRRATTEYVVNLNPGASNVRAVRFVQGTLVTITVTSDFDTDVDLHVLDNRQQPIISDIRPDKDCRVEFRVPRTDTYLIKVENLGPGFNRSVVRYW